MELIHLSLSLRHRQTSRLPLRSHILPHIGHSGIPPQVNGGSYAYAVGLMRWEVKREVSLSFSQPLCLSWL